MKYALFNEFDKVFLKYIRTNLSKHAMEKKEREENKKMSFAECPRSDTRHTMPATPRPPTHGKHRCRPATSISCS